MPTPFAIDTDAGDGCTELGRDIQHLPPVEWVKRENADSYHYIIEESGGGHHPREFNDYDLGRESSSL